MHRHLANTLLPEDACHCDWSSFLHSPFPFGILFYPFILALSLYPRILSIDLPCTDVIMQFNAGFTLPCASVFAGGYRVTLVPPRWGAGCATEAAAVPDFEP